MIPAPLAHVLLLCIVASSILLMLIRPRDIPEVYGVGGGAILPIVLRLIPLRLLLGLRKEEVKVSLLDFLGVGVVSMPVALPSATAGAILMQLLVKGS